MPGAPHRRRAGNRRAVVAFVGALVVVLVVGCTPTDGPGSTASSTPAATIGAPGPTSTPAPAPPDPTGTAAASPETGSALALLATLPVKGRAPLTGYDRGAFGYDVEDLDGDGCDTRNEILLRDLSDVTLRPTGCLVATGSLADPYSGRTIAFVRGVATSSAVQVDHVVALADAWQKGAQRWDEATRVRFGNDPLNLLAVDGPLNQRKGAGDAATWLPPNTAYRCAYVARQVEVKSAYGLWVTRAEQDAIARVLQACPDEPLPDASSNGWTPPAAPSEPEVEPSDGGDPTGSSDVYYESCTAAREAGAAPLHRGEPGYRSGMDGDDDGIACE
ncbi:excalibur calcium-binding domain-containing protein [Cellulomonas sp. DKR-3]|uniref:Excalibur calcium-binding domain-containing protein n=1 Tax=Cellulomonas fulva TaxID=2835530 RepID=A0ABS5U2F1_9CELL|nr:excalibur calcium-binding domain-containing protein [Cellulomonas fulva]